MKRFEDLLAWQKSREIVKMIYFITKKDSINKDYGLTNQLQRSAVSIMTNIAEGFERIHLKEKIQFYYIARASCGELRSLVYVIVDIYPELKTNCDKINEELETAGKMITGLLKSTEQRKQVPNS